MRAAQLSLSPRTLVLALTLPLACAGSNGGGGGAGAGTGGSRTGGAMLGSGGAVIGTGGAATGGVMMTGTGGSGTGGGPMGTGGAGGGAEVGGTGGAAETGAPETATEVAGERPAPGGPFTLSSSAFQPNGVIMRKYRCSYEDVSPPLSWTPGPAGTLSYAVTMRSAGSPHWALWDIPADVTSLPEKIERLATPPIPSGSKQCKPNVDGSTWYGYAGACPRGGTNLRPYYFEIYALKVERLPNVTPESNIRDVNTAIKANQIGMATLIGMAAPQSP